VRQVAVGRDECLLRRVARLVFASEDAVGERVDASLPTAHDLAERLRVARHGALDQQFVARPNAQHQEAVSY
jgi:hypothetical protein